MERLLKLMDLFCPRPGLYIGATSMPRMRAFLDGYVTALAQLGELQDYPFGGFTRWLEARHGISHPGWSWDRILVHVAGSDREAILRLPEQFALYRTELADGTFDPNRVNVPCREPEQTHTEGYNER